MRRRISSYAEKFIHATVLCRSVVGVRKAQYPQAQYPHLVALVQCAESCHLVPFALHAVNQ